MDPAGLTRPLNWFPNSTLYQPELQARDPEIMILTAFSSTLLLYQYLIEPTLGFDTHCLALHLHVRREANEV